MPSAPSSRRCWPAITSSTRRPASRSSPSACTSSSAAATRSTPRWRRRKTATSPPRASSSCRATGAGSSCRWPSAASAARNTTRCTGSRTPRPDASPIGRARSPTNPARSRPPRLPLPRLRQPLARRSAGDHRAPARGLAGGAQGRAARQVEPPDQAAAARAGRRCWDRKRQPATSTTSCARPSGSACTAACRTAAAPESDFGKLASLTSEGRSTATTILSLSLIRASARRHGPGCRRRASCSASPTTGRMPRCRPATSTTSSRSACCAAALYRAVAGRRRSRACPTTCWPQRVFEALSLPLALYASDPTVEFQAKRETERALRDVLATASTATCGAAGASRRPTWSSAACSRSSTSRWTSCAPRRSTGPICTRRWLTPRPRHAHAVAKVLLDYLRRELAIKVDYLDPVYQESLQQLSSQRLVRPVGHRRGRAHGARIHRFPARGTAGRQPGNVYLSARGGFGQYLRRAGHLPALRRRSSQSTKRSSSSASSSRPCAWPAWSRSCTSRTTRTDVPGYQLPASALDLARRRRQRPPSTTRSACRGSPAPRRRHQPVLRALLPRRRRDAARHRGARAHGPGAVRGRERRERSASATATLPILYCSPTMELGVDIAELNVVNMRNVPPTPANYAQRSGRAGRSGQPALVFTYCSTGSPHDQYFFKRPEQMVAGAVTPPRLDLANEDLVRAHVHAIWLAETGLSLGQLAERRAGPRRRDPDPGAAGLGAGQRIGSPRANEHARGPAGTHLRRLDAPSSRRPAGTTPAGSTASSARSRPRFDRACDRWREPVPGRARRRRTVQNTRSSATPRAAPGTSSRPSACAPRPSPSSTCSPRASTSASPTSTATATSPARASCPATASRACRCRPTSPAGAGARPSDDEFLSPPALPGHLRVRPAQHRLPRGLALHHQQGHPAGRRTAGRGPADDDRQAVPDVRLPPPAAGDEAEPRPLRALRRAARRRRCATSSGLQNVATKRRDRINSDEEERLRMGYELRTAVRFAGQQPADQFAARPLWSAPTAWRCCG